MRSLQLLSLLVASFGLVACDQTVTVQNGQIPAQYLLAAKTIVGNYTGSAAGIPNTLTIALNGNQAALSGANDLLGSACHARLGELLSFTYNTDSGTPVITGASFALDPGYCVTNVLASQVDLSFTGTRNFSLSFLNHVEYQNRCYYYANAELPNHGLERGEFTGPHGGDHDGDHDGDHGGWHGNPYPNPYPPTPRCYIEAVNVYTYGNFSR